MSTETPPTPPTDPGPAPEEPVPPTDDGPRGRPGRPTDPEPAPEPVPPASLTFRRWLDDDEREALTKPKRRELRKARRKAHNLKRWPATEGRPPWLVTAEATALRLTARAVRVLAEAAKRAVFAAAAAVLAGGQLRHEFAVAALMTAVAGEAFDLTKEYASELIADTFEAMVDED